MNTKWKVCKPGGMLGRWFVPQATMDRKGNVMITPFTWELLGSCPFAVVLFDAEQQVIGIAPQPSETCDTFPLVESSRGRGRRIRAASLRRQIPFPDENTIRFANPFVDDEGILNLDLKTAASAYHGRRIGAYHTERKEKLPRLRPPRPNWLGDTNGE